MFKAWCRVLLLIAIAIQSYGCPAVLVAGAVGGVAGAAGTVWVKGKLKEELNVPVPKLHRAARAALKDLKLPVIEDKGDKLTAHLESEFSDGKHVWIDIRSLSDSSTRITIRVGTLGDESRSRKILKTVRRHL